MTLLQRQETGRFIELIFVEVKTQKIKYNDKELNKPQQK